MSVISAIASSQIEADKYLLTTNLMPQYDAQLIGEMAAPGKDALALRRHIPLMPLMEVGFGSESYIPIHDTDNVFYEFMGLLVNRSSLVSNLYVIENIPHPYTAEYPTRIGNKLSSRSKYSPIVGFIVQGSSHRLAKKDIALLTTDKVNPDIIHLGRMQSASVIATLLLGACARAELKYARYLANHADEAQKSQYEQQIKTAPLSVGISA